MAVFSDRQAQHLLIADDVDVASTPEGKTHIARFLTWLDR